jgi:hypothetical protein
LNNALIKLAKKVIGINVLRKEVPSLTSRTKDDFINYLYKHNKKRLEWLANYFSLSKTKNAFFLYSPTPLNFDQLNGKAIKDTTNDVIFDFKMVNTQDDDSIVNVNAHSAVIVYDNVEEPENLTLMNVRFRKPFSIFFIYHGKDSILECRTRSLPKFNILKSTIESEFGCETAALVITDEEYSSIDKVTRYKSLTASGLNLAGASKISIEGEDVEQTIKFFMSKRIDLKSYCKDFVYDKAVTEKKSLRFYKNGKVTYRRTVEDIYEELRGVLLNHVQSPDK